MHCLRRFATAAALTLAIAGVRPRAARTDDPPSAPAPAPDPEQAASLARSEALREQAQELRAKGDYAASHPARPRGTRDSREIAREGPPGGRDGAAEPFVARLRPGDIRGSQVASGARPRDLREGVREGPSRRRDNASTHRPTPPGSGSLRRGTSTPRAGLGDLRECVGERPCLFVATSLSSLAVLLQAQGAYGERNGCFSSGRWRSTSGR